MARLHLEEATYGGARKKKSGGNRERERDKHTHTQRAEEVKREWRKVEGEIGGWVAVENSSIWRYATINKLYEKT